MGFLACLVGVVVLIIMIQPPPPAAVVLVGADYADNLMVPHNVLGWQGLVGIEKVSAIPPPWSLFTPAALQLIRAPRVIDQADQWDRLIEDLRKTGFRQQTILFVVELHGISHPGGAYLVPGKLARPEEERERLDLAHVIETMGKLPAEKSKILVLEGAQIPADWRLGMLHNDFPRRLEELEPEILKVPNLWVLSGCDVDQRCWSSEGLGRTVFSHYIVEALKGKVDSSDRRLTLDALHGYVRKSVRDWVWNARGAIQEPVLLPRAKHVRQSGAEGTDAAKDEAAEKVARRSAKTVFLASMQNVPSAQPPPSPDLEELSAVWKKFHKLDALVPHPVVYSPRRWSQFKAELVRYEELHRAGAAAKAVSVRARIDALDSALSHERLLKLRASAENTLTMIAVAGGRVEPPPSASRDSFLRFWQASRDEAMRIWDSLRTSEASLTETPSIRIRLDEFLIQRAAQNSIRNLQPVAEKLMITHKGSDYPQPAEVHFLRMLARWYRSRSTRAPELARLIDQSLAVRMLAERTVLGLSPTEDGQAYSYSEQIFPWIKSLIEEGDEQRRQGEDLLFASEKTAWARSEQAFNQAELIYKDAVRRAVTIRAALAARDHAMAVLPDYSRWIAHRTSEELHNDLTSRVEELWDTTHQLTARLEKPEVKADLGPFARLSRSLTQGLDHLTQRFQTARSNEDWEAATAAVAVPFPDKADLALRNALWVRLDNIRLRDQEVADPRKAPSVNFSDEDRTNEAKRVRRRTQIQGLMSLATLGSSWFDDPGVFKGPGLADFASTMKKIGRAAKNDEERAGTSWKDLAEAGDLVGKRWRAMEPHIDRLVDEEGAMTDLRGFQDRLTKADRLDRQIDGSALRLEESAHEATARLRETRVHDLLLAMADRTWLDHWYDEDPGPPTPPYYKAAGSKFIDDANKLCDRSPLVRSTQARLNQKGLLEIEGRRSVVLTSEPGVGLKYTVVAKGTVPPGIPVVKPVPDRLLELEGESPGFRSVSMGSGSDANVEFTVLSPLVSRAETDPKLNRPKVELTSLKVEGWFRGQPLALTTEVQLHPVPDTVAIGPLPAAPPDASIAVRANREIIRRFGASTGSIAIVLDCSDSMLERTPNGRTKFEDAKKALAEVLSLVPQGPAVSIWTFSQLPEGVSEVYEGDPIGVEPERTIQRLWRHDTWDPRQIDDLVKKLDQLRPRLSTPLVQAMWAAAGDLKDAKGLKTLLVLTDGMDNRFAANRTFNPDNLSIPDFFARYFKPLGMSVNIIFFTPAGKKQEIATAKANFAPALKGLEPPGKFVTADNLNELIDTLTRAIKQKLTCEILKPDLTPVGEEPLDVTGPGDADKWWTRGLAPRIYRLRVHAGKSYEQDIDLREGDRMVVELVDGPEGGIAFQRALYSDGEDFQDRIKAEQGGWRLAVRSNRRLRQAGEERLQMLASLERKPDRSGTQRLQQVRPRLAWFRLQAQDDEHSETAFSVRWHERIFYPGPVWQFDVPRWVDDLAGEGLAKPNLKAWWSNPETRLPVAGVIHLDPPGVVQDLPRELQVEGDKIVRIEFLGVEEHYIEDRPGEPPQPKSCLVVRLAFPKDSPYLVDPGTINGVQTVGYEHRLYSQAGKYTGLFWPVNKPQIQTLSSLNLIALDAFRDEAEQHKNAVEIKLSRPRIEDQIPDPPDALLNGN